MASKVARDARLTELVTKVNEWADKKQESLDRQVVRGKAILRGRTGAERLNNESVSSASILLTDEIGKFLQG
jgi:hypothetical protein